MEGLSSTLLLTIGICLIFLEIVFYSFFIIWLGVALVIVAIIQYFMPLPSIWTQLVLASVISITLFALFYKPLKSFVNKSPGLKDDFIKQYGKGMIKNQMLSYQGSYFKVVNYDISALEGIEVTVVKIEKNNAWIKYE
jgi:membrane protein implicated in regulation of membrane protease activity